MRVPSGDHDGSLDPVPGLLAVTLTRPDPSRFMTTISSTPVKEAANAMRVPSGDQSGPEAMPLGRFTGSDPSESTAAIARPGPLAKAILLPSGDQAGCVPAIRL